MKQLPPIQRRSDCMTHRFGGIYGCFYFVYWGTNTYYKKTVAITSYKLRKRNASVACEPKCQEKTNHKKSC